MPKFFFVARDRGGKKVSGVEEAYNQDEVISRLQSRDLTVVSVFPESREVAAGVSSTGGGKGKFTPQHYGIKSDDLVVFCRQIATLLGAGVTILKSLDIIEQQIASRKLARVIRELKKNMEGGFSFHEAMAKHPTVFSELWVNLVESGEASGNLAVVLARLATYLERNAAFKKKIISALIYPIILMVAGIGALLFLTLKIIPPFAELFKGFNIELPLLTKILINTSTFIKNYMWLVILAGVVGFMLLRRYIKTGDGRRKYENFLFNLPTIGEFFRIFVVERFTSEMATLVESGVPILYSLEIAEHSVGNLVFSEVVRTVKDNVRQGKPLSEPLQKSGFFEPMAVQMVTIGEEIGELPNMFKRLNTFYQESIDTYLVRITSMFEPIMLVFMGVVIGIMVVGMFLPIFQIAQIKG